MAQTAFLGVPDGRKLCHRLDFTNVVFNQAYQRLATAPRNAPGLRPTLRSSLAPHQAGSCGEPKHKAPVMLLDELAIVDCCAGVSFYAP